MKPRKYLPQETKDEILARVARGERVSALAREHDINESVIYNWISALKKADPNYQAKLDAPPLSLDEQIEALTADYIAKMKALLLKQVYNNLKTMSL